MSKKRIKTSDRKRREQPGFPGTDRSVILTYRVKGIGLGNVAQRAGIKHHTPRDMTTPTQRLIISPQAYNHFISEGSSPSRRMNGRWRTMNWKSRLEFHLFQIADTTEFSYEIL